MLNSLAGEAINRNLRVLRPFGRFLELGKRDFYENTKIGLRPFRNNIAYFGIDADQLMVERPDLTRRLFLELLSLFEQGALKPLPYRSFSAGEAVDAFRYMQQSKQIGKVILTLGDAVSECASDDERLSGLTIRPEANYLITGGLSGFGLKTAEWLSKKGARHLVLVSRSGRRFAAVASVIAGLTGQGVDIRTVACDVTDRTATQRLLTELNGSGRPLAGNHPRGRRHRRWIRPHPVRGADWSGIRAKDSRRPRVRRLCQVHISRLSGLLFLGHDTFRESGTGELRGCESFSRSPERGAQIRWGARLLHELRPDRRRWAISRATIGSARASKLGWEVRL